MDDKVALVTGGSSGIGFETARRLAGLGYDVTIVGRDPKRSAQALEEIRAASASHAGSLIRADLSSMQEVRRLAADFRKAHKRLDVLVNNAAVMLAKRTTTEDGFETTFATNHLAPFLLTELLLPLLRRSAPARVVNLTSGLHMQGHLDLEDLQNEKDYSGMSAYSRSKLANVLFTYELARRVKEDEITVNALFPGMVRTRWARDMGKQGRLIYAMMLPVSKSAKAAAKTVVWAATDPRLVGTTGQYFVNKKPSRSAGETYDEALAKRVWDESERLVGQRAA